MQRRHNCSLAASFANCVMTLYLLKVHLQTFLCIPITQKSQILSCDPLIANERYKLIAAYYHCQLRVCGLYLHSYGHCLLNTLMFPSTDLQNEASVFSTSIRSLLTSLYYMALPTSSPCYSFGQITYNVP
jgi:hypothetical protein